MKQLFGILVILLIFDGIAWAQHPPVKRLTAMINSYPCPSPDGKKVVFQSNRTGRSELFLMNADGTNLQQLTSEPGDNVCPVWSPDGKQIVFAATPNDNSDIYLINADGTNRRRLTTNPGDESHPHWSADGTRIIFNSARTTSDLTADWGQQWHEVFSMKTDGSDLRQHTSNKTVCTYPSFSPDGKKIAFRKITQTPGFNWDLSNGRRNSEVFVANIDGTGEINLSNSAAFDGWPAWSPDGTKIAFISNRKGPANVGQLFLVNPDGTGLQQITNDGWSYAQPAWSSDGKYIYLYQNMEENDEEFGNVGVIELKAVNQ